jgi:alpha-ketoglutaric semialdehyde dehydrogenase
MSKIINRNPRCISKVISEHETSSESELNEILKRSAEAFKSWSSIPAPKRAQYLLRAAEIYKSRKTELSKILHEENGKSLEEAGGEIQEVIDTLEFFYGEGRRMYGMTGQSEMPYKSIMTIREPIGPALLITAWNFPAAVPSWKAAPCLVAGNTFILKPSEQAPLSGKIFVDILNETGLPEGVAQLAMGDGKVGEYLAKAKETKILSVTGSVETGRKIAAIAAENFKKCALELGGKNSSIIMADADLKLALDGTLWGAYGTGGQRCTSTSRLIIDSRISENFISILKSELAKFYDEVSQSPSADYCPVISLKQLEKTDSMVKKAQEEGLELIVGGKILDNGRDIGPAKAYYYAPTILRYKTSAQEISNERNLPKIAYKEVFGPVLLVIELDPTNLNPEEFLEKALMISNNVDYGLSNSIYTRDINLAMKAAYRFESGLVYLNAPTIGAECGGASFFGGWKETGNGSREGGLAALDTYTQYKTISIDYLASLQRAQID